MRKIQFSQRLKELRKTLKLTQKEFGDKIDRSRDTIFNWEQGRSFPPDLERLISLLHRIFNVNPSWFREEKEPMFEVQKILVKEIADRYVEDLKDKEGKYKEFDERTKKILLFIEDWADTMSTELKDEVYRYLEEKKLLTELLKEKLGR